MKHILCALMQPNEYILKEIYEYGYTHGWLIERCDRNVPLHWEGAGILSDYLEMTDFAPIRNFEKIPTVSRLLPPRGNIRTIRPDTTKIAENIVNYFVDRGFTRFATPISKIFPEDIDGKPRDLLTALKRALEARGFLLECCFMEEKRLDYPGRMEKLRSFFAGMKKPFALILSSRIFLPMCYRVLHEMNLQVPEEVAVLSNADDWDVTEKSFISTTYISGEFFELGRMMVELLERMMAGEEIPEKPIWVTPSAIVSRASTDTFAVSDLRLARAGSFFLQNYGNVISVEDAARVAGISPSQLSRLFQHYFGKTPIRFLQEIRFNHIRKLLDTTSLPLNEIARQSGYGSGMALSLAFKRETGMTPGAYRQTRRHLEK